MNHESLSSSSSNSYLQLLSSDTDTQPTTGQNTKMRLDTVSVSVVLLFQLLSQN